MGKLNGGKKPIKKAVRAVKKAIAKKGG